MARLRAAAAFWLALTFVAVSPAAAQLLHEAAEELGVPYLHAHGRLIHSHPHGDGHHDANGFAAITAAPADQAPSPAAPAVAPSPAPAPQAPASVRLERRAQSAPRPLPSKRAPPGARAPPA